MVRLRIMIISFVPNMLPYRLNLCFWCARMFSILVSFLNPL